MENRSPKLPVSKGKYQSSCIWGLVDMFDFRNGRTNQQLLSNGRIMHKHGFDARRSRNLDASSNFCERCQHMEEGAGLGDHAVDACKTKVKDIMQGEFPSEKQIKTLLKAMKQQSKRSDVDSIHEIANSHKDPEKASQILLDYRKENHQGHHQCSCSGELPLDSHSFAVMLEEICSRIHQGGICNGDIQRSISPSRFKQLDEINVQLLQMSAKAFIDQIYINRRYLRKDAASSKSKPFSDASEILHVNRDLFLKLLQDPNSLLVRHIQKLQFPPREKERINLLLDSKSSDRDTGIRSCGDSKCTMTIQKKNTNTLLWKKLKHRYGFLLKGNSSCVSKEIVLLKPASKSKKNSENVSCHCSSMQSQQSLKIKGRNTKSTYFSWKEITRKFKRAVGESQKEQHSTSLDDSLNKLSRNNPFLKYVHKGISHTVATGESTPFHDTKRMEKRQKPIGLVSYNVPEIDFNCLAECKHLKSSTTSCSKQRQSDIFIEAKRHLSERFRNVNVAETPPRKQTPTTLQMILSSPDHESLITHSPKREMSASVSTQMRISPYSNIEKGKEVSWPSPQKNNEDVQLAADSGSDDNMEIFQSRPNISQKIGDDTEVRKNICATGDNLKPSGYVNVLEENESILHGNLNIFEVPCESNEVDSTCCGSSIEATKLSEDNGYGSLSLADSSGDHHKRSLLGPSSSPLDVSTLDTCKYREGHPSPVSVLEPFSPEDANSPTSNTAKQDESSLQPRHIDFDDHSHFESPEDPKVNITACMDEKEYMSAYVRVVMQSSNLNLDELSASSPSLPHDLNTYSVDSAGFFQVESNCELNLLLDCIHEVLLGVYRCYFGYSPWLSFLKPNIRPALEEANVVNEVVKEVNCYISPKLGQPTLDQLAGMDMAKFGLWLEIRPDTEDIVNQIAEDVLQESIVDVILELQI